MRPLALLLLLAASCAPLQAQVQERKLFDRIMKPDYEMGNAMQNKSFYSGGGASGLGDSKANVKDFYFVQKFSAKAYETKEFSARSYWQGDFQFTTKAAETKADPAAGKVFATKTMAVKDARESGKDYETREFATREAHPVGKLSQQKLNEQFFGKGKMSMDQVRDLLNKNH